ncbi:MAG: hypothetical protein JWR59_2123 [Brevundimonas sp.]|nr:hypothetical protein [Brevundimonas sp.]
MAPFLVILMLLALGAGIIAWHTTGPAVRQPPQSPARKPRPERVNRGEPIIEDIIASPEPAPFVRSADPFAHAPASTDRDPPQ